MPHREAAWALLEERLRDAANFCDLMQKSSAERVASELENVRTSLLGIADSLPSQFGDWRAVSRFAAGEPAKERTAATDAVLKKVERVAEIQPARGVARWRGPPDDEYCAGWPPVAPTRGVRNRGRG